MKYSEVVDMANDYLKLVKDENKFVLTIIDKDTVTIQRTTNTEKENSDTPHKRQFPEYFWTQNRIENEFLLFERNSPFVASVLKATVRQPGTLFWQLTKSDEDSIIRHICLYGIMAYVNHIYGNCVSYANIDERIVKRVREERDKTKLVWVYDKESLQFKLLKNNIEGGYDRFCFDTLSPTSSGYWERNINCKKLFPTPWDGIVYINYTLGISPCYQYHEGLASREIGKLKDAQDRLVANNYVNYIIKTEKGD